MTRDRLRWPSIWRRLLFFGLTFFTSLSASALMADILRTNGFTPWEKSSLIVFFVLFTWITGAFWTAMAGFVIQRSAEYDLHHFQFGLVEFYDVGVFQ